MASISPQSPGREQGKRKPISRRLRYEILRRDDHTCRYCGLTAGATELTIDHVVPVALGGTDEPGNLVAACKDCNAGKTSSSPDESTVAQATSDALRWSAALQVAAGLAADDVAADHLYARDLDTVWSSWKNDSGDTPPRPTDWRMSVHTWRTAGMPIEVLVDAADRAMANRQVGFYDKWRYFCGITWKRLTEIQEAARRSLASADPAPADVPEWEQGFDAAVTMPTIGYGWYSFRALSDVVDGPEKWNARRREVDA